MPGLKVLRLFASSARLREKQANGSLDGFVHDAAAQSIAIVVSFAIVVRSPTLLLLR
jgi:hypothetical protein